MQRKNLWAFSSELCGCTQMRERGAGLLCRQRHNRRGRGKTWPQNFLLIYESANAIKVMNKRHARYLDQ